MSDKPPRRLGGLIERRPRWGLTWRGWTVGGGLLLVMTWLVVWGVYPFLAVTERVDARTLVIEGWIDEYSIRAGAEEFRAGAYSTVFTTGGPVSGMGGYTNDYNTSASVGADLLRKAGISDDSIRMVPSKVMSRDRTFHSAVALRDWFREHQVKVDKLNVVTEDVHARRTRLLYQKAFGGNAAIGIIAVPSPDYDATHWWRYSEGFKDVLAEGAAYLYARLLFWPDE